MGLEYIATEPVRQLHRMWNSFFEISSADAKFLMVCHSQGAIHVRNALLDYPPDFRERILVLAIAPGAYIYKETCAKVIHYRAEWWRDFVPRLDRSGATREKDFVVTLASHPKASAFDHEFMSPTYQVMLRQHITNYIQS
jgi:pimeloyl-ACP methyl ester carboxylesterase